MAQQDPKGYAVVDERLRTGRASPIWHGIDTGDGDALAVQVENLGCVPQETSLLEIPELRGTRERITSDRDVVVPEHDER
jgi:hypothetical protein